jgi:hypothetical protein
MGRDWIDGYPVLTELVCTTRFGNGRLGSAAHHCDGLARSAPSQRISVPSSEQDMIFAAGIKDQELTIIVSIMLMEFAPDARCPLIRLQ